MTFPSAFNPEAFQHDAFQIQQVTVALTGLQADTAAGDLTPSIATQQDQQTGQTPAGKSRRKRKWIVTLEGKDYLVDSLQEAHDLCAAFRPKETPKATRRQKPQRRVSVEIRLEDSPTLDLKFDGKPLATVIAERVPDEAVVRAAVDAWLRAMEEDDEEVLLLL